MSPVLNFLNHPLSALSLERLYQIEAQKAKIKNDITDIRIIAPAGLGFTNVNNIESTFSNTKHNKILHIKPRDK